MGVRSERRMMKSLMSAPWNEMRPCTASSQAISPGGTRNRIAPSSMYALPSEQAVGDFLVALHARALEHGLLVPVEAQPGEPVEDHLRMLVGRAGLVGVFDAQQELAAFVAGVQPVEKRGASASDVEEAGGGGGEADAGGHETGVRCWVSGVRRSAWLRGL